jgi:hypothetical protein
MKIKTKKSIFNKLNIQELKKKKPISKKISKNMDRIQQNSVG